MAVSRSPFPGMDPWLEGAWGDVHQGVITNLADQIADGLPDGLFVRVEERVYVLDPGEEPWRYIPDAGLFSGDGGEPSPTQAGVAAAVAEPIRLVARDEPVTEGVIEIRRQHDDRPLVTAVDVLSPTNKCTARGRRDYRRKRQAYRRGRVNLVELDLLRAGNDLADTGGPVRPAWATAYQCVVRRYDRSGRSDLYLYPLPLRHRLPRIAVPLRPGDADVAVDLQGAIDYVYRRGRYGAELDYGRPPTPPLSPADATWAAELVAAAAAAEH